MQNSDWLFAIPSNRLREKVDTKKQNVKTKKSINLLHSLNSFALILGYAHVFEHTVNL